MAHRLLSEAALTETKMNPGTDLEAEPAWLITDRHGWVEDANLEACILLDMGRRALIGKRLSTFVDRADQSRLEQLGHVEAGERVRLRLRDRVGRLHLADLVVTAPPLGGRISLRVARVLRAA